MTRYRIKEKIYANGKTRFYPQYKWFIFWLHFSQVRDISMANYRVWFPHRLEAFDFIKAKHESKLEDKLNVVIKTQYQDIPL